MNQVKVLLLIPRKKDNVNVTSESMQHRKVFKKIWSTEEEREKRIKELRGVASVYPEYKWRIYETINWRDLRKTYFNWQKKMLDWQRTDIDGAMDWLDKVHSEWTSTMMTPECRCKHNPLFLIDKDDKENVLELEKYFVGVGIEVLEKYETPSGWHFITKPFNTSVIQIDTHGCEIHTDGLRLVEVI
jgi:hypothetical protein